MNDENVNVGKCVTSAVVAILMQMAFAEVEPLAKPWIEKGETLVCFGDSITAGNASYVRLLADALEPKGVKVVNAGLPGDKTPMALTRIRDVSEQKPDAVVFFFGANDSVIGRGRWRDEPVVEPTTFRDNLVWMMYYLKRTGVEKFSVVVPPGRCEGVGLSEFGSVCVAYQLAAREAADRMNAVLVPLDYVFAQAYKVGAPSERGLLMTTDGVHFSQKGKELASETMLEAWNMK